MVRSTAAVFAGLSFTVALSLAADAAVLNLFPWAFRGPEGGSAFGLLLLAVAYVGVATALGGYLTARVARSHPVGHALVLGGLSVLLMAVGTAFTWASAPAWYHAASLALVVPAASLGGYLRAREARPRWWARGA